MSQKSILVSFFLLLSLCSLLPAQSGLKVGEWRDYISYRQATEVVYRRGTAYTIVLGGMFSYTPATEEVRTFSTIQGLHSTDPTRIFHDETTGLIFIGFADGTINYFSDPDDIRFLTDIQRNNFFTQKEINAFAGDGERLYVATDFGVVIYDLESFLTAFTVTQFGENPSKLPVKAIAVHQGRIWLSLGDMGLYSASSNAINLSDPGIWRREDGENGLPMVDALDVASLGDRMYLRVDTTVYARDASGQWGIEGFFDREWDNLSSQQGSVTVSKNSSTRIIDQQGNTRDIFTGGRVLSAVAVGDTVFLANFFNGLQLSIRGQSGFEAIAPDGPYTNNCTRIVAGNGEFYVAPKGHDPAFNPSPDASGIFYYNQRTGWTLLNKFNGSLDENGLSERFARAYYNPNSRTAYLGSWGMGLMELKDGVPVASYTCENSGLSQVTVDCDLSYRENTRVSGLAMDPTGNLWVSMSFAQAPLAVRLANGEWFQYPANLFPNNNFIDLIVDDYGSKWILNRRNGVWIFNDNGTPTNLADDVNLRLTSGLNEGFLPSDNVLSIAKDQDGFVWVGTDVGVTVFFDPFSISQGVRVDASCPVFDLRCLLKDEQINAIAVDGGNRKWMATNNGVFLVSEDGDELIANFTIENSPLLSNNVLDVTVDNQTGEVFFATEKGLISYQGDATSGAENCDDVLVYPNPVFRSFDGMITIKGSSAGSKVKITTASGMLVQELEAQGGTATWNGMDLYGNKVASGIYLALISRDDGSKACIGKFSVINR